MARAEGHDNPRKPYGDRWAFYICHELDCGFFYNGKSKPVAIPQIEILVLALGKKVKLTHVGTGEAGHQKLMEQGMENAVFPVNLFNRPFQIDVKVSGTVTPELHEKWLKLIAYYKNEPFVSERKEYVRVLDENGKIVQQRLCTAEELQMVLEREADARTKRLDEWRPGQWRLATDEEKKLS